MAAIITEKFRLHNADQFEESFTESSNNTYYLFIGKSMPFTSGTSGGSDSSPPTPTDGPTEEFYAWDSMIAAKKISSTNVKRMLPRRNWSNGTRASRRKRSAVKMIRVKRRTFLSILEFKPFMQSNYTHC